ncbi:heparan-alpha-glucosaminide N-acetyltransferase [Bacillota bacterium LX-D]|nr:heparan-alpha-glucosaminide N-acetyltransferase [Bacillota bacterium LX-D]
MSTPVKKQRIWEIDFFRGVAIVLMVIFHLIYDLKEFYHYPLNYEEGFFYYIGKAAASLFIFLCGVSSSLSHNNFHRGLKLLLLGFLITIVTAIFVPGSNIIFGILHFLGLSVLLYPFFYPLPPAVIVLIGFFCIGIGTYLPKVVTTHNFFAPLGLTSARFYSADYYPLFPWLGLFLFGAAWGKMKYSQGKSLFRFQLKSDFFQILGRHSLLIYVLHQPLLLAVLYLLNKMKISL